MANNHIKIQRKHVPATPKLGLAIRPTQYQPAVWEKGRENKSTSNELKKPNVSLAGICLPNEVSPQGCKAQ